MRKVAAGLHPHRAGATRATAALANGTKTAATTPNVYSSWLERQMAWNAHWPGRWRDGEERRGTMNRKDEKQGGWGTWRRRLNTSRHSTDLWTSDTPKSIETRALLESARHTTSCEGHFGGLGHCDRRSQVPTFEIL